MIHRHPDEYELQRRQGSVLINEGLVERATGNYRRAVHLLLQGIEATQKYLFPSEERHRGILINMALLDASDLYLRLGEHGRAIEILSRVDPSRIQALERGRYCYVQARYWLSLSHATKAQEWAAEIGEVQSWDPEWPVLDLEIQADIAKVQGDVAGGRALLEKALSEATQRNLHGLSELIRARLQ